MIVTCPNCGTKFNLPETQATPGAKLRCSVCKHVFQLSDDVKPAEIRMEPDLSLSSPSLSMPPKKKGGIWGWVLTLLILCAVAEGTWWAWTYAPLFNTVKEMIAPPKKQSPVELVKNIALRGVRQCNISNEKLDNISVVEGKVVGSFNQPRELIRIEASLYDSAGNALVSKQQLAGTSLSLFQLQVLGEQDIEQALANKIDIMATNTSVLPGGEVPFMVIFYSPPDNAAEFGVKVIDTRIPPEKEKK